MSAVVLDASALLALLLNETGAERVRAALADASMSTANLAEIVSYLTRQELTEAEIRELLMPLPIAWTDFDADLAYRAGMLTPQTKSAGLSLGDRACLALAQRSAVAALTADRSWASVGEKVGIAIETIR